MEPYQENSTSCFTNSTLEGMGLQAGIRGMAVVICVIVMVLILCLKVYKTIVDRLVLYITLSEFLFSASSEIQVISIMIFDVSDGVCSTVGYMITSTACMSGLFLVVLSLHLFLLVAFQVKLSKWELLIVVIIPIISAANAALPFATSSYGSTTAWCWINYSKAGFVEQMISCAIRLMVYAFYLFSTVYVVWVVCRQRGARRQYMEAVKETIYLVLAPFTYGLLSMMDLANRIDYYNSNCRSILWWLAIALTPLADIVATLLLLFHVVLTAHRRRKRKRQRLRSESETRYIVPAEFSSEAEPLVITGTRPQEPATMYNSLFLTDSINKS